MQSLNSAWFYATIDIHGMKGEVRILKVRYFLAVALSALLLAGCGSAAPDEMRVESAEETTAATIVPESYGMVWGVTESKGHAYRDEDEPISAAEELKEITSIHYFSFPSNDLFHEDSSGTLLLQEHRIEPVFYCEDRELSAWINGILQQIHYKDATHASQLLEYAGNELAALGKDHFYPYSYHVSMGVGRHDDRVISLLSLSTSYSGGVHPNSVQTAHNLDIRRMKVLELEDVIREDRVEALYALIVDEMELNLSKLGSGALYENYKQIIANSTSYGNMTSYWYLNDKGLVVFFNQYELGPYTSGIMMAQLTYDQLDGILLDEYMPYEYECLAKDVEITREPDPNDWIYCIHLGEGETVYISPIGEAAHIQLSELHLAGDILVGETMLFSASRIDETMTIQITGDLTNKQKLYAVEYFDSSGGPSVLFVCGGKIYEELPLDVLE